MKNIKIITIVGARPQFIKAAAVSRAIKNYNENSNFDIQKVNVSEKIIHTGQHYDANMSDIFFDEMSIPKPAFNLAVGGGTHGKMTGQQLEKIECVIIEEEPDVVLVYGDTNSTLAGALAAAKMNVPVVHVEAGLRSFNMKMPEEINRILTDNVSTLLLCPSPLALNNLSKEGFHYKNHCSMHNVGDVMFDAVKYYSSFSRKPQNITSDNFVLLTVHRAENTDDLFKLKVIADAVNVLSETVDVIFPIHPRTKKILTDNNIRINANLIEPVGYFEMLWLIKNSNYVMTDSGGLQKEAYFLNKGCVTLRDQTEWVELIEAKVNVLTEIEISSILNACQFISSVKFDTESCGDFYGDGQASLKIIKRIVETFS